MKKEVVPAILTVSHNELAEKLQVLNAKGGTVHIDIMDGIFVHQNTFYFDEKLAGMKKYMSDLAVEFHLMVEKPIDYANVIQMIGPKMVILHAESFNSPEEMLDVVHSFEHQNVQVSLTSFPNMLPPIIEGVSNYQIMGVEPGLSGQQLIPDTGLRIEELKRQAKSGMIISVDGGVNFDNAKMLYESGATRLIMNSAFWRSSDPGKEIKELI